MEQELLIKALADLKEISISMFAAYPDVNSFFVTTDNQFFTEQYRDHAAAHQRMRDEMKPLKVITREMASQEEPWMPEGTEAPAAPEEVIPTEASTKEEIASYLKGKGIEADAKEKKPELLTKLKQYAISTTSSVEVTEVPSEDSTEEEIKAFLKSKGTEFKEEETKTELLSKIADYLKNA